MTFLPAVPVSVAGPSPAGLKTKFTVSVTPWLSVTVNVTLSVEGGIVPGLKVTPLFKAVSTSASEPEPVEGVVTPLPDASVVAATVKVSVDEPGSESETSRPEIVVDPSGL